MYTTITVHFWQIAFCLFFNFLNAIKEGDGERIMQQYKYIMLYCKANGSHSTKYALECLTQFFFVLHCYRKETVGSLYGTALQTTVVKKLLISQLMKTQNMRAMP